MGMYDDVIFEDVCPDCGSKVDGFQSKDGGCTLNLLNFWEVNNFYAACPKCNCWIEYNLKLKRLPMPIEAYERTTRSSKNANRR